MLKPNSTYKMSKTIKRILASNNMTDNHRRGEYKDLMIQSELYAALQVKREKKSKVESNQEIDE